MANIAYFRVSTNDQTIESQRHLLGDIPIDKEFVDEGTSGAVCALERTGFRAMAEYIREGDTVFVTAIDRIGRDAIDIQTTFRDIFKKKGVRLNVVGLGPIEGEMGDIVLTLFAQFAEMERNRIRSRTNAGRAKAREVFEKTGRTHNGKPTLAGRPFVVDPREVRMWRQNNKASIAETADHFDISLATVKKYCSRDGTQRDRRR